MVSGIENTVALLCVHRALASGEGQSPVCLNCNAMQCVVSVGSLAPQDSIVLQENYQ